MAENQPSPAPRVHVLGEDDEDGGVPAAAGDGTAARSILYCACPPCHLHGRRRHGRCRRRGRAARRGGERVSVKCDSTHLCRLAFLGLP